MRQGLWTKWSFGAAIEGFDRQLRPTAVAYVSV